MKKILFMLATLSSLMAQTLYVNDIKVDLLNPKNKEVVGEIYEGSPVELIKEQGEYSLVRIKGEIDSTNDKVLAYKKDPLLIFYKLNNGKAKSDDQFLIKSKSLNKDQLTSWEEIDFFYYDTCSSCHAAHKPKEHLMSEWEAYLSAMQTFAKINDEEKARILRYMHAFAKDGPVKE